jgi:hypothetical protein
MEGTLPEAEGLECEGQKVTGHDELLYSRVAQLREIEDHLERIERMLRVGSVEMARVKLQQLRADVLLAIRQAEREHAEF